MPITKYYLGFLSSSGIIEQQYPQIQTANFSRYIIFKMRKKPLRRYFRLVIQYFTPNSLS